MPSDTSKGSKEMNKAAMLALRGRRLFDSLHDRFFSERNEKMTQTLLLLATALILTLLIVPSQHFHTSQYNAGEIAPADIKATQSYLLEDLSLTEKKRSEVEKSTPFVYDFHLAKGEELKSSFARGFALLNDSRTQGTADHEALLKQLSEEFDCPVTPVELASLQKIRNPRALLAEFGRVADSIYRYKLVNDKTMFNDDRRHGIVLYERQTGRLVGAGDTSVTAIDLKEAAGIIRDLRVSGIDRKEAAVIKGLFLKALKPNLTRNLAATDAKKAEARKSISPVVYQIKRGEMIVREGERISDEQAIKLNKIYSSAQGINRFLAGIGIFALILVMFYFPYRFGRKNIRKFNPALKDLLFLSLVTIFLFLFLKIAFIVSSAMGILFPQIGTDDYFYLLPFAAGAMIVRIILNSEVAMVYCAVTALLLGVLFNSNLEIVIYALLGGIIGAHGVRQCQYRGTIYSAGLKVSIVNLALAIPFQILSDTLFSSQTLYIIVFALVGGVINSVVVAGIVPVVENLFHYTTDIKLLELASLNSPVLRELMIRAPGTYHHSILVGTMVEAAAEAIHANPLMARVAAYYHDIGKISKPLYFIENMCGGDNRHDKLSPSMSALILISHVKEGVELAKEKRLGVPIIDIIRQHHGTALISFFYQKAKSAEDPEARNVEERDFRYPGPKPQTREAGLVMLADCVEAASKTLTDPTPSRIQGMVQKIINNIFIDGQLEECELTLKNLHDIANSFNRILSGIYHHRIDYPEPAFKVSGRKKAVEDSTREQAKTPSCRSEEDKKVGGEDLKRLGIHR
ncbi:MAG: HDIG domain-containing protein [Geobacter sp.]|nr:MAG: HDIG domain-containing protein [Geobacter sp.]